MRRFSILRPEETALAVAMALTLCAPAALSQDVLTVGGANAVAGSSVKVPIYLRDVGGTPLGVDQPAGHRIQGLSFKLTFSPAGAVKGASVARAGVTSTLTSFFETSQPGAGSVGWIAAFDETAQPVSLTLDAPGYGDQVAYLTFSVSPGLAAGTKILIVPSASSTTTALSNQGGTALETTPSGLSVAPGMVSIGPFWGDANLDGAIDVFDLTILSNYLVGNVQPGVAPFLATLPAMNLDPAKGATVDVFDLVLLSNAIVGNVPALPVP